MGGAAPTADRPQKGKSGGLRRPKRRISVLIDMTPMVDIAFLLLIFYMVTTVFSMPQAMEVNLPPASDLDSIPPLKIKESKLLTIRVDADDNFYWSIGKDLPMPVAEDQIDSLLEAMNKEDKGDGKWDPKRDFNTLIIINPKARFSAMVDLLDEIDLLERKFNALIASAMGVTYREFMNVNHDRYLEFYEKKFSYRYAMAPWEDRDGRMIEKSLSQLGGE